MGLSISASEQEAFLLITDYFASKHMKIVTANPPSRIRAEFGSWTSLSLDNAKGEVEVEITKSNSGSCTNLAFRFRKEHLVAWIIAIFATVILCVIMWWRANSDISQINPANTSNFILRVSLITFGLSAVIFVAAIGLVLYSTSATRKRLIEEFSLFIQSLHSEKD
jgi:small-conductance mechanosensitive channel